MALISQAVEVKGLTEVRSLFTSMQEEYPKALTIAVNHGVSEEWGVRNLAAYLAKIFPALDLFHIPQRCPYAVMMR